MERSHKASITNMYSTFREKLQPSSTSSKSDEFIDDDEKDNFDPDRPAMPQFSKEKNMYANRYTDTSKRFKGFWSLLSMWKGSVWKLMWHDLLIFVALYALLSILYRTVFFHHERMREGFEVVCIYSSRFRGMLPITFMTGFYVSQVVSRYWDQARNLPYPDRVAMMLVSFIPGQDEFRRNLKRTVMRYVNLSFILVFRLISHKVYQRFPNYKSLIEAKLILEHEAKRLQSIDDRTPHEATWTPVLWALKLIQRARSEKKIEIEPPPFATLVSSFNYIEICNRKLLNYGWINFPFAYTQVVTVSAFMYFAASLFACQHLVPQDHHADNHTFPLLDISFSSEAPYLLHTPDIYVPVFAIMEFVCYMAWIKVAEALLNPFGGDDEDFQINYLIDRNLQVSYLIVDEAEKQIEMSPDPFLEVGIGIPKELPYPTNIPKDAASRMKEAVVVVQQQQQQTATTTGEDTVPFILTPTRKL